jgi:hypothetical protein
MSAAGVTTSGFGQDGGVPDACHACPVHCQVTEVDGAVGAVGVVGLVGVDGVVAAGGVGDVGVELPPPPQFAPPITAPITKISAIAFLMRTALYGPAMGKSLESHQDF